MNIRYLRVMILSGAGLVAAMLLLLANRAMPVPALKAASLAVSGGTIPMQTVLTPAKDNTIYDTSPPSSNGAGAYLFVGNNSGNNGPSFSRRALLAFDIAHSIPPSSTILSVTLQLQMSQSPNANGTPIRLHPLLVDWGEGTSNAGSSGGRGATPSTGDATWQHTFFNTQFWQNEGGDFSATTSATTTVAGADVYLWGSTDELINDVQGWLDDPSTNFGWILVGNESVNSTVKRFATSENTSAEDRPQLTIVYTTPGQPTQPLYLPLIQTP